ncbi:MAG: PDZ domain-containing protein [Terracidiphilus sp.]|nr:PDZ domain-containing protein [Terracidiphilus sp.]MDR3776791.1 PDZ domain-containing protein [Terracidiphilus sp.]
MKHILRPCKSFGLVVLLGMAAIAAMAPPGAAAQSRQVVALLRMPQLLLLHSASQGYLGVDVADVDGEKAQSLKLKETRGAVITLIDHDAPAGQIGLKVNDVVLSVNGQNVEGAEQLRRMLREIPAGHKASLLISRDGNQQTLTVQLVDRKAMEHDVWSKIGNGGDVFAGATGMGILSGGGDGSLPSGFHMPIFGSSLNVGALVEPLTSQMAEYLGVPSGLMVKQVARKSEAAAAGLKAFDVILKVGPENINTLSDWDRALHANQGKPVQVTILRDRKQQTVTLQVDSKRRGALEIEDLFPEGNCPLVAGIDPEFSQDLAKTLRNQLGDLHIEINPQQAEQMRQQAEKLRDSLKSENFKLDQKELDQLKQQMEEFRKSFKAEDFKLDPKQMDELKREMDQLKRQMEEMKAQKFGEPI